MFGVESFIAVINPPEAGILAIGAIQPQPAVVDDRIVVRSLMTATLSADHRVADGIVGGPIPGPVCVRSLENPAHVIAAPKEMHP